MEPVFLNFSGFCEGKPSPAAVTRFFLKNIIQDVDVPCQYVSWYTHTPCVVLTLPDGCAGDARADQDARRIQQGGVSSVHRASGSATSKHQGWRLRHSLSLILTRAVGRESLYGDEQAAAPAYHPGQDGRPDCRLCTAQQEPQPHQIRAG